MRQAAADIFDSYKALWARASAEGAGVTYDGTCEPDGYFDLGENGAEYPLPVIGIYRKWPELPCDPCRGYGVDAPPDAKPPDLKKELIVLAHEFGHLMSWKGRTPRAEWECYYAVATKRNQVVSESKKAARAVPEDQQTQFQIDALRRALTDEERALVLTEEALAWDIAREALAALEFADWPAFDREREQSLHVHRYRLGLDELLDTDV